MTVNASARAARLLAAFSFVAAAAAPAAAQTLHLTDSSATVLRGGSYANTNLSSQTLLETRASGDATYVRRILLKFDTHETLPMGTPVSSASLTLTVAGGNAEQRRLAVYRVPSPYNEWEATWKRRKAGISWDTVGGEMPTRVATQTVTATKGSKVTFDVTDFVDDVVKGTYSATSRYARFLVVDAGGSSREGYKQYYSDEAADVSVRPSLTMVYGRAAAPTPSPTLPPPSGNGQAGGEDSGGDDDADDSDDSDDNDSDNDDSDDDGVDDDGRTLRLRNSSATVLRSGSYASTNLSSQLLLETRASGDAAHGRILLKFDTHNTLPKGTPVASASLTLTVGGGNREQRRLEVYRVASSYNEWEATWNRRKRSLHWSAAGGDPRQRVGVQTVTDAVGSKVTFDVTAFVNDVVKGTYSTTSRYARFLVLDAGGASRDGYTQYFSDEAADASVRPVLTISYGTAATPTPTAPATGSTSPPPATHDGAVKLKVLDWNIHHGVDARGKYRVEDQAAYIAGLDPDVVSLNEVERYTGWGNEDQPARFAALLKAKTGRTWYYKFAQIYGNARGQGNLLLSIYPFEATDDHLLSYRRSVAQATIIVNGRRISLFSTHLDAESGGRRATQMSELTRWAASFAGSRVLIGDFNAWPGAGEINRMTAGHTDVWAAAKKARTAVAYAGNAAGNTRRSRIDYVWLSKEADSLKIAGARVFDARDARGVMLSDHRPVMAIFDVR